MKRALALMILLMNLSPANAIDDLDPSAWNCSMTVRATGVPSHFQIYGRDSWTGTSTLFCQKGVFSRTPKMTVTFNSFGDGFGADARSSHTFTISLTTQSDPSDLKARVFVVNVEPPGPSGAIRWPFATGLTSGIVALGRVDESRVLRSLQRGTLYLRDALE